MNMRLIFHFPRVLKYSGELPSVLLFKEDAKQLSRVYHDFYLFIYFLICSPRNKCYVSLFCPMAVMSLLPLYVQHHYLG